MSALGMTALHLRIAEFKSKHNFIIGNQLPETELFFWNSHTKEVFYLLCLGQGKNCYIQKEGKFLTYTRNCEQKATISTVKSTLKIPPWHDGVIPIKISGPFIEEQMAYFITDDNTTKGRDPNINIINGIHKIKEKNICHYTCFKLYKQSCNLSQRKMCGIPWPHPYQWHNNRSNRSSPNKQYNVTEDDGRAS